RSLPSPLCHPATVPSLPSTVPSPHLLPYTLPTMASNDTPQSDKTKEGKDDGYFNVENATVTGAETDGPKSKDEKKSDNEKNGGVKLTEEQKLAKNKAFIFGMAKRMLVKKYTEEYFPATSNDIKTVLKHVQKVFEAEPVMVHCKAPACVVGDIHGQYEDLQRIFTMFEVGGVQGYLNQRFVFLGDYVDRGKQSVEVVISLFCLKVCFPNEFILLRGNHECRPINKSYGFLAELRERYHKKDAMYLFEKFNHVFNYMPLVCILADKILCMHGGICPEMKSRDVFKEIPKPMKDSNVHPVAASLLWSDPMIGEPKYRPNRIRGLGIHFGEALLAEVMAKLDVKLVVRGHQMMMNGFNF
ncbi:hypothetical protein PFISCL1PPCAC_11557, partial [Pristionchus fissidentatus]